MSAANAYARAGVDTAAGDRAVELMKDAVVATQGPEVITDASGFAGLYDFASLPRLERPLLATSTDGVGTKIQIAKALQIYDTVGFDLVGMVVDDLTPLGAKPLFMTDYIACGHVVPERIAAIVRGVANACKAVDCALVAGETAEHPGVIAPDDFDIAGAATGVVDAPRMLGPKRVYAGDLLVGLASSGLHSNGYSLVRRIVADNDLSWDDPIDSRYGVMPHGDSPFAAQPYTLGLALLEPTRLYSQLCLDLEAQGYEFAQEAADFSGCLHGNRVHAFAHVTGGGLAANLCRIIPAGLHAVVDRGAWQVPGIFKYLMDAGTLDTISAEDTWNLGVGMVAVVHPDFVSATEALARQYAIDAFVIGRVGDTPPDRDGRVVTGTKGVNGGSVTLCGDYRL